MEASYLKDILLSWPFSDLFHLFGIHIQFIWRNHKTQIKELCLHERGLFHINQQFLLLQPPHYQFKCLKFSSLVFLKTNISSRYTTTNLPIKYFSISFINIIKVLRAFFKTNGITSHSYNPSFVLKVVYHSPVSLILI